MSDGSYFWTTIAVAVAALGVFAPEALLRSLKIGLSLFYKALWPILFGVLITAAIETFVDKERMAEVLGGRDLLTTGKATVAGAVSSACTFGAVSIAQTLFKKEASPHSTFAFSFAATNMVFELGILIYILLGPAFLAAELIGRFPPHRDHVPYRELHAAEENVRRGALASAGVGRR